MSKLKIDSDPTGTAEAIAVPGSKPLSQGFREPRIFRDNLFTSRTLVLPDGSTASVARGQVTAVDDQQLAYFISHPDLEPIPE